MYSSRKRFKIAILLLMLTLLMAADASAFNGRRKGFVLGIGFGPGLTVNRGDNDFSLSMNFDIGWGLSDQFTLCLSQKDSFYSTFSYTEQFGVFGPGICYYLAPEAPCTYLTSLLGVAYRSDVDGDYDSHYGFGLSAGMGYEFRPHFSVECTLLNGSIHYSGGTYAATWSLRVTINALAF